MVLVCCMQDIADYLSLKPMFVIEGATRFDLYQGKIGKSFLYTDSNLGECNVCYIEVVCR